MRLNVYSKIKFVEQELCFGNHLNDSLSLFDFFNIPVPLGLHWKGNLRLRTAAAPEWVLRT